MNKEQFLSALNEALSPLSRSEREDILSDYIEHFRAGRENGKSQEEVAQALGDPAELARAYVEELAGTKEHGYSEPNPSVSNSQVPLAVEQTQTFLVQPVIPDQPHAQEVPPAGRSSNHSGKSTTLGIVVVVLVNVFLGAWILLSLAAAVLSLWAVPVCFFFTGIATIVGAIVSFSGMLPLVFSLFGVSLIALSGLAGIGMYYLSRFFIRGVTRYIQFCARLCKEGL